MITRPRRPQRPLVASPRPLGPGAPPLSHRIAAPLSREGDRPLRGARVRVRARARADAHARNTHGGYLSMPSRRIPRRTSRAMSYVETLAGPETTGAKALETAWDWFKKELYELAEDRPQKADWIRWLIARLLASWAANMSKVQIQPDDRRTGLSPQERHNLLHPRPPQEGGRQ